eukprot:7985731-Alexandrium_andersonii.AAC.1
MCIRDRCCRAVAAEPPPSCLPGREVRQADGPDQVHLCLNFGASALKGLLVCREGPELQAPAPL